MSAERTTHFLLNYRLLPEFCFMLTQNVNIIQMVCFLNVIEICTYIKGWIRFIAF